MSKKEEVIIFFCNNCDGEFKEEEVKIIGDEAVCIRCENTYFIRCYSCNDHLHEDNAYYGDEEGHCQDCYYENFYSCEECGEGVHYDNSYCRNDEYYCEYCYDHLGGDAQSLIDSKPLSYRGVANVSDNCDDRLVGIEAECIYPHKDSMSSPENWSMCSDGSISRPDGYSSVEWVSRPANGEKLRATINNLIKWTSEENGEVNRSCGLHVHIDATDTTWRDLVGIALVTHKIEPYVFKMMPLSRRNSNWCAELPLSAGSLASISSEEEFIDLWYDAAGSEPSNDKYNDARYMGLNLHARYYLGTIEFRYHSGTLNRDKITNWIKLCNSIVTTGIELARNKDWEHRDFFRSRDAAKRSDVVYKMINLDQEVIDYMIDRAVLFLGNEKIRPRNHSRYDMDLDDLVTWENAYNTNDMVMNLTAEGD